MRPVVLSRRAEPDLRGLGRGDALSRMRDALQALAAGESDLDVKPLAGSAPWRRLRVGEYRVLHRPVAPSEAGGSGAGILVARVVHPRDLERAVATLE